jgi:hypothetical protein
LPLEKRAAIDQTMTDIRPPDVSDWNHFRALREQWTHEDNLVNQRMTWLMLSEGLLFTAYATLSAAGTRWLIMGFPFFGMAVAAVIGTSIYTALAATEEIRKQFDQAGLVHLCSLAPASHVAKRGRWAAQTLPYVFGALWLLALASSLGS